MVPLVTVSAEVVVRVDDDGFAAFYARVEPRLRRVVLIHGYAWTLAEVAALLDVRVTTVQNRLERGLARLRDHLKAGTDD